MKATVYLDKSVKKWWQLTPNYAFLYFDKTINTWFAIYTCNRQEYQGCSCISPELAYNRLAEKAHGRVPDYREFKFYPVLEEVLEKEIYLW